VNKKKQKNFFILGHGCDVANARGRESKKFFAPGAPSRFFQKAAACYRFGGLCAYAQPGIRLQHRFGNVDRSQQLRGWKFNLAAPVNVQVINRPHR
jgi:hypothetical protein